MNRNLTICACLALGLLGRADEVFPVMHSEPIAVRVLAGNDAKPQPRTHVVLTAGYDLRDLRLGLWHEEAVTDEDGRVRLSDGLRNLPLLRVNVLKLHACGVGDPVCSVELIRRDGQSAVNRCGTAIPQNMPGVFTVYVKAKKAAKKRIHPTPQSPPKKP